MTKQQPSELSVFLARLGNGIWFLAIPSWLFGLAARSAASLQRSFSS